MTDDTGDESCVYLRDGAPVHVERSSEIDRLDHVLIETGVLSAAVLAAAQGEVGPSARLGEVLMRRGHLTEAVLADALKLQLRRKIVRLFFARKGRFAVYLDPHAYGVGDEFALARIDPRCLVLPGDQGGLRRGAAARGASAAAGAQLPSDLDAPGGPARRHGLRGGRPHD